MSYYHAEVVNLSLKNVDIINNYKTIDIKKRVWGFVKIYTLLIPSEKIDEAVNYFQSNMRIINIVLNQLGLYFRISPQIR